MDISADTTIGSDSSVLNVNAGQLDTGNTNGFKAEFGGSDASSAITVTGAATGKNEITIGTATKSYYTDRITVVGSADDDTITINFANENDLLDLVRTGTLDIDLGTGTNSITFAGCSGLTDQDDIAEVMDCISGDGLVAGTTVTFS